MFNESVEVNCSFVFDPECCTVGRFCISVRRRFAHDSCIDEMFLSTDKMVLRYLRFVFVPERLLGSACV